MPKDEKKFIAIDGPVGLGEVVPVPEAESQQAVRDAVQDDFILASAAVNKFRTQGFDLLEEIKDIPGEHMAGVRATIGFCLGILETCVKRNK